MNIEEFMQSKQEEIRREVSDEIALRQGNALDGLARFPANESVIDIMMRIVIRRHVEFFIVDNQIVLIGKE